MLPGQSVTFSAARLLCSNTDPRCFRAEAPQFIQEDSIEMPPLKRGQVAGLSEWP